MSIQDWGAIGELVGGVGIIVSLIYVGVQIRQNTIITRVSTTQAFAEQLNMIVMPISRGDFRDIYWRGISGISKLEGSELAAFGAWLSQLMRFWETVYFQRQEGVLDERLWSGWNTQFRDSFGYAGIREFWSIRRHQFNEEFCDFVDQLVASGMSKPLYEPQEMQD